MTGFEAANAVLRFLVYVGSIAAAGGVLFAVTFPDAARAVREPLHRQVIAGCAVLLLVEPLRYVAFQLAAAQGDWGMAFGPELRWMAMQTPAGPAALARFGAAAVLAFAWRRSTALATAAAGLMIGSFLFEGHTASAEMRDAVLSAALLVHLAAAHWWIGSLRPLEGLARANDAPLLTATVERFGRMAVWIVAALAVAGGYALLTLMDWSLKPESAYQQRFAFKLLAFSGLLSIAAWNRLRLTPLLASRAPIGAQRLRASIQIERAVAALVLAATAWALQTGPDE